jgi:predicted dithiol-disulfide oxidoreductase (DUF899 family)
MTDDAGGLLGVIPGRERTTPLPAGDVTCAPVRVVAHLSVRLFPGRDMSETTSPQTTRFPNESAEYRSARDVLLRAEEDLRDRVEVVATLRRSLPLGGTVPEDYAFHEGGTDLNDRTTVRSVRLSELFAPDHGDSLLLYNFMYGPEMKAACPSCTSILDSLNGASPHLQNRTNFVVVAKNLIAKLRDYARGRAWTNVRLLSSSENSFNHDYGGESADGHQMPVMHVFVRRDGAIHHWWSSELLYSKPRPGQDSRHVDMVWPLWNMFDLLPEGRGTTWNPRLSYDETVPLTRAR